jgi:hypothetical protein
MHVERGVQCSELRIFIRISNTTFFEERGHSHEVSKVSPALPSGSIFSLRLPSSNICSLLHCIFDRVPLPGNMQCQARSTRIESPSNTATSDLLIPKVDIVPHCRAKPYEADPGEEEGLRKAFCLVSGDKISAFACRLV